MVDFCVFYVLKKEYSHMVEWKKNFGNLSLTLGKGLVVVSINWRMIKPSGYDVFVNKQMINESVPNVEDAKRYAIENLRHRLGILQEDIESL